MTLQEFHKLLHRKEWSLLYIWGYLELLTYAQEYLKQSCRYPAYTLTN